MSPTHRLAAPVCIALIALPLGAHAQSETLLASAVVPKISLEVTTVTDLRFGDLYPGVSVTVDPRVSADAAALEIRMVEGSELRLSMTLPRQLHADTTAATLPISYGPKAACQGASRQRGACEYFDPERPFATGPGAPAEGAEGRVYVWLGATLTPSEDQVPGTYGAVATASVSYTAN